VGDYEPVPSAPAYAIKLHAVLPEISSDVHITFLRLEKYCFKIEGRGSSFVWSFNEKNRCDYVYVWKKSLCVCVYGVQISG